MISGVNRREEEVQCQAEKTQVRPTCLLSLDFLYVGSTTIRNTIHLGAVDGLLADDGPGGVVGGDDLGGGDVSVGLGLVGVGGLGHGEGGAADLGGHLSEGVGLGGGVGEVAAQAVRLDGGGVMGGRAGQGGGADADGLDGQLGAGGGHGRDGEEDENLKEAAAALRDLLRNQQSSSH